MTHKIKHVPVLLLSVSAFALMLTACQPANPEMAEPSPDAVEADETASAESTAITVSNGTSSVVVDPANWPEGESGVERDPEIEAFIADLVSRMSVEEKVGQIIQADISTVTPELAAQYNLGSILNGGNSGPGDDNFAPPEAWLALADEYYNASTDTSDGGVGIPIIWGTDAVHGHSNIVGATLFPHNIGLGAANDPDLIRRIGEVTALEIRATGQDWTFAPTLAVVQNDTWGRTYEGYSENPEIVARLSAPMVEGLQGLAGSDDLLGADHIVATAKHWVGDGGTDRGIDQGDNRSSEAEMRDIHAAGYRPAIAAGVQTVMASFNSWHGVKMHGNGAMLTDVLVDRMGFDGFVIGDWEGHGQIAGCENENCPQALLAGVDMYMASGSWRGLYESLLAQVRDGTIPMERLDEAVTRILRVKARAGLFDGVAPSQRPHAGDFDLIGSEAHRAVAREAVRRSLVLLRNDDGLLPLDPGAHVLLAGPGADNIRIQSGGWTINWQGDGHTNEDFPGGQSVFDAFEEALSGAGGRVTLSEEGGYTDRPDVAVVVFGEEPYAEFVGDRETVDFDDDRGLDLLRQFQADGIPTVAVFISGRPLWVNTELNASDAFVAAWLPGSEAGGIADVLVGNADGTPRHDFTGRLSYSWPRRADQTVLNPWDEGYEPLFAYGFGLSYAEPGEPFVELSEESGLSETGGDRLVLMENGRAMSGLALMLSSGGEAVAVNGPDAATPDGLVSTTLDERDVQDDTRRFNWSDNASVRLTGEASDLPDNQLIQISYQVTDSGNGPVSFAMGCGEGCEGAVDVTAGIRWAENKDWQIASLPLRCFAEAGADLSAIDAPLIITGPEGLDLWIDDISISGEAAEDAACEL
ncbi:glycoside hydrolase family 3 N-terminal domain-containing protein [Hyphobacterium sp. HN65]|uniref:Glycoside hydrolase family 3 N-terminal domain-containing protein n=1 Tax=Hyphobacterium lacteum TaxID=3116575 RepID=A0ABU7LSD4_9PROT|nr:glycoside hydrolase family 3 N-terminal domain-containing protein [Hyphobacterium sp. HN65]MEE2526832.1 glycoside hydrolase family 3 N-terminal domain-containing protein [Hyphobacterium sp. HN65]